MARINLGYRHMKLVTVLAIVAATTLCRTNQASASDETNAPPADRSIYESIELGFKLCSKQIIGQGHLAPEHAAMLKDMGVSLVRNVPANVTQNTGPLFLKDPIYAQIDADGAGVFIVTSKGHIACRVVVTDTADALKPRIQFVDALRRTSTWTYDQRRSGTFAGQMREELTAADGRLVAIMNGPNVIANDGKGVQAFLTVAAIPPTAMADQ